MRIFEFVSTKHPHGTIAMLKPSKKVANELYNWCKNNNIQCIDKDDFHCTVLFSKKPVEHLVKHNNKKVIVDAKIKGWKKLGSALTLELHAPRANKIHKYMIEQGGTHDFPDFIAHVSISYDWPNQELPNTTPDIPLIFDKLTVDQIDPNFAS